MDRKMSQSLDRHITGNYGEDQFEGDITEYLLDVLSEIAALPTHPCDDARNLSGLEVAKRKAATALENADRIF